MTFQSGLDGPSNPVSGKSTSPRKQIGSNIGLRRQQLPHINAADREVIRDPLHQKHGSQRPAQFADKSAPQHARPENQPGRSQILLQRRERFLQSNGQAARSDIDSTSGERSIGLVHSTVSKIQELERASVSSDDGSSPAILINPDPDLLPVVKTDHARASFDFYINSYVTSIIEVSPDSVGNYPSIVHQILHDELLFTAFTTCSEAARWRSQSLYDDPPLSVARGYGKTISLLSQRLRSEKFAMSSTVLLTMGQLTAIETLIKNVSATARHLAGMQSVMKATSGTKPSAGSSMVQTAVDVWTQYFMCRAYVKTQLHTGKPLTYPRHPFDPKLSIQISELPLGFADVALSGRCSTQLLGLISRFDTYFITVNEMNKEGIMDSPERTKVVLLQAAYCIEFVQIRELTLIERLILVGLTAHVVRRDRIHPALINIRNYFQITCAFLVNLMQSPGIQLHTQDQGSELINWIGLVLLLTSSPEAHARKLALKLLPNRPEPMKILKKCSEYYWDDDLTNALLSGNVLGTATSNDIIADNVKQSMLEDDHHDEDDSRSTDDAS